MEDILTLGMRADDARRARDPALRVRYQRVHSVNIADVGEGFSVPEAASEVRVFGTPSSAGEAARVLRAVRTAAGARPVSAFSYGDLVERNLLSVLAEAGATDVGEFPVDRIDDLTTHVRAARAAGLCVRRLTVADPLGDRKTDVLDRVARCVKEAGIERFAPLPRNVPVDKPTTGYEDVRMVALARLALNGGAAKHPVFIEVDWILYGPKLAQVALTFGADFLDAVPATSDDALGRRRGTVEDVERNIRAAGFEPLEYKPVA